MDTNKEVYKKRSKIVFDGQATTYDSTYYGRHARKLYSGVIEKVLLLKCKSILDVGCGTGTILSMLDKSGDFNLAGVDLSSEMIKITKKKLGSGVDIKIGDSERIPWEDNKFDVIICTDSFHHYPEPEKVLVEMNRVLKPQGHLIIGDPTLPIIIRQIFNKFLKYNKDGDFRIYSKVEMNKLLLEASFSLIDFQKISCDAFILVAKNIK